MRDHRCKMKYWIKGTKLIIFAGFSFKGLKLSGYRIYYKSPNRHANSTKNELFISSHNKISTLKLAGNENFIQKLRSRLGKSGKS